jgi:hypothetical protein
MVYTLFSPDGWHLPRRMPWKSTNKQEQRFDALEFFPNFLGRNGDGLETSSLIPAFSPRRRRMVVSRSAVRCLSNVGKRCDGCSLSPRERVRVRGKCRLDHDNARLEGNVIQSKVAAHSAGAKTSDGNEMVWAVTFRLATIASMRLCRPKCYACGGKVCKRCCENIHSATLPCCHSPPQRGKGRDAALRRPVSEARRPYRPSNFCPSIARNFQPDLSVAICTAPAVRV